VGEGRGWGGQHSGWAARSAGNGPRPVGAGSAARPCQAIGGNRGGEGG
jgi:hypothetical protein